jgi:uncharacterized repeat protein (TIGR01451 family)
VGSLLAGGTSSANTIVTIPLGTAAGTYFLGACADVTGVWPESNETDNCRSSITTITVTAPDLTIAKTHSGNFSRGQTGATYTITVTNGGNGTTSGQVTVTDTLPTGLTATGLSGSGWTCAPLLYCPNQSVTRGQMAVFLVRALGLI